MSCADDFADKTVLDVLRGLVLVVLAAMLEEVVIGLVGVVKVVDVTCDGFLGILVTVSTQRL